MPPSALHGTRFASVPDWRFVVRHPAHLLGMGLGVGLIPFAPGTFGTLLALPLFWALHPRLAPDDFLLLLGFLYLAGIWVCDRTGRDLGIEDYKGIVWDETVAFLIVLFFTPPTPAWQAVAFLLFRLFDIFKPGPIRYAERMFRGGFGVMIDDLVAAFFTLLCLTLYTMLMGLSGGWFGSGPA
jgi:phosphatidylglycerophosphatase A